MDITLQLLIISGVVIVLMLAAAAGVQLFKHRTLPSAMFEDMEGHEFE